jgi:hypothetical protein
MKKLLKAGSLALVVVIMVSSLSLSAFAASSSTTFSSYVLNAFFTANSDTASSNYAYTDKTGVPASYNVYKLEVKGTITGSAVGTQNYIYVYNVDHDADAYISIPCSGTFTASINTNIPLNSEWYFQLMPFRSPTDTTESTTVTDGKAVFYYNY